MDAHGLGKNLQHWRNQIITAPASGGKKSEQLLGRTHRPRPDGDEVDSVEASICQHTEAFRDALKKARQAARYIQAVTKNQQKLLYANYHGFNFQNSDSEAEGFVADDDDDEDDVEDSDDSQ